MMKSPRQDTEHHRPPLPCTTGIGVDDFRGSPGLCGCAIALVDIQDVDLGAAAKRVS